MNRVMTDAELRGVVGGMGAGWSSVGKLAATKLIRPLSSSVSRTRPAPTTSFSAAPTSTTPFLPGKTCAGGVCGA